MNDAVPGPQAIVIVGGGHAAAQLCAGLAEAGWGARVQLVCDEAELPYQRPPLSKAFLKKPDELLQPHRPAAWYAEAGIQVHLHDAAVALDCSARRLSLRSGRVLGYDRLVLATGARARHPAGWPQGLVNVAALRGAADARQLRSLLGAAQRVTVLGGGFIGLEVAASARVLGKDVVVLEAAPRLLARSVSADLAAHVLATHRAAGIDLRLAVAVAEPQVEGDRLVALAVDGQREPVELLLLGIGAAPDTALAQAAGLALGAGSGGIAVDAQMRSSDPAVLAIGDCAEFPHAASARRLRLESVQNANDQARTALATLLGRDEPYRALPWFWSEQGAMRLQMAGLLPADATGHRRAGANAGSFSLFHYAGEQLQCVESVNAPLDHMMARKLLEAGKSPAPHDVCDGAQPLKSFL